MNRHRFSGIPRLRGSLPVLLFLLSSFLLSPLHANSRENPAAPDNLGKIRNHLAAILKQSEVLQKEIRLLENKKATPKITEKILERQTRMDALDADFNSLATRLSREKIFQQQKPELNWSKELKDLMRPFIDALSKLTEKPRKIDSLKKKIAALKQKKTLYEKATRQIDRLIAHETATAAPKGAAENKLLSKLLFLKDKFDPELVDLYLNEAKINLQNELSTEDASLLDSTRDFIMDFFKNRGRNLLVTALTFAGLWWLLMSARKLIVGKRGLTQRTPFVRKILRAAYNSFVMVVCLAASLICLYLFNDWLLISLVIMGILVAAWTSRNWLPRFLQEMRFILNLGTVREKERLIWKGVPWRVEDIGLYATLKNERLGGGLLMLPVKELVGLHSRPVVEGEPWFPTNPGDWVLLADGTYGKVEYQTVEQVVLRLEGDTRRYYSTAGFLGNTPKNISQGFRYFIEFGLDYNIQRRVCDDIPAMFDAGIRRHLSGHFREESPDFISLRVTFDNAGASSLNLMILVDVDGRCAGKYHDYRREVQAALVRVCNENGLAIPFTQVTVSLAEDLKKAATAALPPPARESGKA